MEEKKGDVYMGNVIKIIGLTLGVTVSSVCSMCGKEILKDMVVDVFKK